MGVGIHDKPFYVDVGSGVVSVRCSSDGDEIASYDIKPCGVQVAGVLCDRLNDEFEKQNKAIVADRDNWMRQALAEDERANAAEAAEWDGVKIRKSLQEIIDIASPISTGDEDDPVERIALVAEKALDRLARNCDRAGDWKEVVSRYEAENGVVLAEREVAVVKWMLGAKVKDGGAR